MLRNTPVVPWS